MRIDATITVWNMTTTGGKYLRKTSRTTILHQSAIDERTPPATEHRGMLVAIRRETRKTTGQPRQMLVATTVVSIDRETDHDRRTVGPRVNHQMTREVHPLAEDAVAEVLAVADHHHDAMVMAEIEGDEDMRLQVPLRIPPTQATRNSKRSTRNAKDNSSSIGTMSKTRTESKEVMENARLSDSRGTKI